MKRPGWCPKDVWYETGLAFDILYDADPAIEGGSEQGIREMSARSTLAERERCGAVANERAAQLYAVLSIPATDEAKAGWAGQMIEALMIEQRISQGHVAKDAIDIEGLHDVARKNGFPV